MSKQIERLGYEISEDGRTLWRVNRGVTERRALYANNQAWEAVAAPAPKTPAELRTHCKQGGFGFEAPAKTLAFDHSGDGGPVRVSADDETPVRSAAEKLARRMYGKRGAVGAIRLDSTSPEGRGTWEVFLGKADDGGVTGQNYWIYE